MRRITNWIVFSLYLVTGHWSLLLQPLQDVNHTNTYLISFVLISLLYFKKQKLNITTINLPPLLKVRDNLKTEVGGIICLSRLHCLIYTNFYRTLSGQILSVQLSPTDKTKHIYP